MELIAASVKGIVVLVAMAAFLIGAFVAAYFYIRAKGAYRGY